MATTLSLTDLSSLENETTALNTINTNNSNLETAAFDALSRSGGAPNYMNSQLDMNSNPIINLPVPSSGSEPLRLLDANLLNGGGTISSYPLPSGGLVNQILQKASATNFDVKWASKENINVQDYGALGNGSADDTSAIAAAIAATPSGGTLVFPETGSNYVVKGSGNQIFLITQPINIYASGQGSGLVIDSSVPNTRPLFRIKTSGVSRGYTFSGLNISSASGTSGGPAFYFDSSQTVSSCVFEVLIERCSIGVTGDTKAIFIDNPLTGTEGGFVNSTIRDNVISGTIYLSNSGDSNRILNNIITQPNAFVNTGSDQMGIYVNLISGAGGCQIIGNNMTCKGGQIVIDEAYNTIIAFNEIEVAYGAGHNGCAIDLNGATAAINTQIIYNQIQIVQTGTQKPIRINNASGTHITGNRISTVSSVFGITVTASATGTVLGTGNVFTGVSEPLTAASTVILAPVSEGTPISLVGNGGADISFPSDILIGAGLIISGPPTTLSVDLSSLEGPGTTGSGNVVLQTSPALITPALGVATGTSLALGGATLGSNDLAVTGTTLLSGVTTVNSNATAPSTNPASTSLRVIGAAASDSIVVDDAIGGKAQILGRRADGTVTSPTAVQSGEQIVLFGARGYGATSYGANAASSVTMVASENWTDTAQGSYLSFQTSTNGTAARTDRGHVEHDGGFTIPSTVTGGSKGAGTLNATGLYISGNQVLQGSYNGKVRLFATGINFNSANSDTAITVVLPSDATRYTVDAVRISGASASISTATAGVFTAASGGGTAVVTGASAITVTSASENTNNNTMLMTVANKDTCSYNVATLYFRVAAAQGTAATANVTIDITPL